MHQLDAGVSLSRAVKLGPGERRRRGIATFVLRLEWFIRKFILTPPVMMGYVNAGLPRWAMWTLSTSEYVRQVWQDVVAAAEDGLVAADVSTAVLELAVPAYMRSRIRMA